MMRARSVVAGLLLFALTALVPELRAQPYPGRLGVEVPGDVFTDIAREHNRWEKRDAGGRWTPLTADDVDSRGWPRIDCRWIIDYRPVAEWDGAIDDPEAYRVDRSGTYRGSFRGRAVLRPAGGDFAIANQRYDSATHTTTFELTIPPPGPHHGLVILEFHETQREPDGPRNSGFTRLRLMRPGYDLDSPELFTREILACLRAAAFSTLRFMSVLETNDNVEWASDGTRTQMWERRKRPDDASVRRMDTIGKKDGWPWEFVIALCNAVQMDLWLNIPVAADDDYIRRLAELVKAELDPRLNVYLEHSNETWNFGFLQYAWNKARAAEEVRAGRARYNFDGVDNEEVWGQRRHAQRLADAVAIFGEVFGAAAIQRRIRGVLAGATADPEGFFVGGRLPGMLEYLRATGQEPRRNVYAIAIPLYYGGAAAAGEAGTEHATVDEILDAMRRSIDRSRSERAAAVALARRFELPGGVCAYESGPDIGGGRTANIANRIRAVRDPRQRELFQRNLVQGFWELGGNLVMQFTLYSPYSRYGAWGLTDDLRHPDRNALFRAVRELIGVRE